MKTGPVSTWPGATTPHTGMPSGFIPGASAAARACMAVLVARLWAWSQGVIMGIGGGAGMGGGMGAGIGCGGGGLPQPPQAEAANARIKLERCFVATFMSCLAFILSTSRFLHRRFGPSHPVRRSGQEPDGRKVASLRDGAKFVVRLGE